MAISLGSLAADDSGAETFGRYRYQSKITLLYWLKTLLRDGPIAVFAEHIEDIALEFATPTATSYVFMQIKSRSEPRPWRAGEMCGDGGGIDSLARAFRAAQHLDATFELHLEGGTSPSTDTATFVSDCSAASAALRTKIKAHLKEVGVRQNQLLPFLRRVSIVPKLPSQVTVDSVCCDMLMRLAPSLNGAQIVALAGVLLQIVEDAQQARHPSLASDADPAEHVRVALDIILRVHTEADRDLASAKRLTRERLRSHLPEEPREEALLFLRVAGSQSISALERKLEASGARAAVIDDAKGLRAMSDARRLEVLSGPDHQIEQLEDLSNRLLTHANAIALRFANTTDPANGIWSDLITVAGLEDTDQFGLFNRDRQALVGLLCCISDECRFGWAIP